jgi:hypothetical protein
MQFFFFFYKSRIEYTTGRYRKSEGNGYSRILKDNRKTNIPGMRDTIRYCVRRGTPKPVLRKPEIYIFKGNKAGTSIFQEYNKHGYYIRKRGRRSYEARNTFEGTL